MARACGTGAPRVPRSRVSVDTAASFRRWGRAPSRAPFATRHSTRRRRKPPVLLRSMPGLLLPFQHMIFAVMTPKASQACSSRVGGEVEGQLEAWP